MRTGFTILELLIVLALLGALSLLSVLPASMIRDRLAVGRAKSEVAHAHWRARSLAKTHRWRVALDLSADALRLRRVDGGRDSVADERAGPSKYGVSMSTSRATVVFGPTGLGWGAANTTIWMGRGRAEATLVTSRLGRLRESR